MATLLIVDDEINQRKLYQEELRDEGYRIQLARNGKEALDSIGISTNRNAIPFDPLPPQQASGLRLGTAATTTRGLGTSEMKQMAAIIHRLLTNLGDEKLKGRLAEEVQDICDRFPLP